ncbi:hypothetical protein CDAR_545381, partial [Caerostris darwini]
PVKYTYSALCLDILWKKGIEYRGNMKLLYNAGVS